MIPIADENPAHRTPLVTVGLIGLCVLAFLGQLLGPGGLERSVWRFGLIPARVLGDADLPASLGAANPAATVVTSMFLHGGWLHLGGNLLYLWIFGNNVEDRLGHVRFLLFYLAAGLAAAALQIAADPSSRLPMVGASGAVSGVLGAYLVLYPRARLLVLLPMLPFLLLHMRAGWMLAFWFAAQLAGATLAPAAGGGVAFWAHVGGFLAGMLVGFSIRSYGSQPGPWGPRR